MNKNWIRSIGLAVPVASILILSKVLGPLGDVNTNLLSTGVTWGGILIAGNIFLFWAIFKKHL